MELISFLIVSFATANSALLHNQLMPIETNKTASIEIVADYINKYLRYNETHLSITVSSANDNNQFRQLNLANSLLTHFKLANFTHSILTEIDQSQKRHKQPFHVLFVDASASLT